MFQLSENETKSLKSQNVILEKLKLLRLQNQTFVNRRGRHIKYLPYAFMEQGVVEMLTRLNEFDGELS